MFESARIGFQRVKIFRDLNNDFFDETYCNRFCV